MRKKFITMCILLALSLTLCFFSMHKQLKALDIIDKIRIETVEIIRGDDPQRAKELIVRMANEFQEQSRILELIASHDDLHDVYAYIVDAQIALECEDMDDTYQALMQLGESLKHIQEHEGFSFANLY